MENPCATSHHVFCADAALEQRLLADELAIQTRLTPFDSTEATL